MEFMEAWNELKYFHGTLNMVMDLQVPQNKIS
jgi:hypothetical protein